MTIQQFLALFPVVKETRDGWKVCCPAHDDHDPSLGVKEGEAGRIVLHCWAHCENRDITAALGLTLADLFPDHAINGHARPLRLPPVKRSPIALAFAFDLHALDLKAQADKILEASGRCTECEGWTLSELDSAMKSVTRAYAFRERAQFCEDYADHLRSTEYELKRLVSC